TVAYATRKRVKKMGRKVSFDEKKQIVQWTINHQNNYKEAASKYDVSYQRVYSWVRKYFTICHNEKLCVLFEADLILIETWSSILLASLFPIDKFIKAFQSILTILVVSAINFPLSIGHIFTVN
ncbi:helix-turn-helix domain-containing protein, partial [uncultured Limosilactobacillus sp.]|uniref:helix-turn-helix domain-containing protein n=1 Tax=uncultured Limosilactobacillus sp. TaxID=2837629 RepID=UPI0025971149